MLIELRELEVSDSAFGVSRPKAVALLAAHDIMMGNRSGGAVGAVSSEGVGPLSRSYQTSGGPTDDDALGMTSAGAMYIELRSKYIMAMRNRMV